MAEYLTFDAIAALFTLTALETVLGIDNIIFLAIIAGRLPREEREKARVTGLALAVVTRVGLLFTLSILMGLTTPLFQLFDHGVSGRDLILIGGGLFLIVKATHEIHARFEETEEMHRTVHPTKSFWIVIAQILLIDIVFSLDSVITAVGMSGQIPVMVAAIVISIGIMLWASKSIVAFVEEHPTIKMLALSFLLLIGVLLVAEGFGKHIDKGYIYFAMFFSLCVELLNMRLTKRRKAAYEADKKAGTAVSLTEAEIGF